MKSISAIEYKVNSTIIRSSSQLQMEEAIMMENSSYFSLAYSSLMFPSDIIKQIGNIGELREVEDLIFNNIDLVSSNQDINSFLRLMY